jgi:Cys-rich repeat protein
MQMMFEACMRPAARVAAGLMMVMGFGLVGCGEDNVGNTPTACSFDNECKLGEVCLLAKKECGQVPCVGADGVANCLDGQICYVTPGGDSFCSRPECSSSAECDAPAVCSAGKCIEEACSSREDCSDGKICNLAGACVDPPATCANDQECPSGSVCFADGVCGSGCAMDADCEAGKYCDTGARLCATGCRDSVECGEGLVCGANRVCSCNATSCGAGKVCDMATGTCMIQNITSCDEVTCQPGTFCDPVDFMCKPGCTDQPGQPTSCQAGEVCNMATGQCVGSTCGGRDGSECTDPTRPKWNNVNCFCAECTTDTECPAGESCNANGTCQACAPCDPATPGICGAGANANAPYCIAGCCVQCIGNADCPAGNICLDGVCGQPPSCAQDPTSCPSGTTCQNGVCQAQQGGGGACDPMDPTSCGGLGFCDPSTNTCTDIGGGLGCGLCNADCTCDGGLTCEQGFFCGGCTAPVDPRCPGGIPGIGGLCLGGLCIPLML